MHQSAVWPSLTLILHIQSESFEQRTKTKSETTTGVKAEGWLVQRRLQPNGEKRCASVYDQQKELGQTESAKARQARANRDERYIYIWGERKR